MPNNLACSIMNILTVESWGSLSGGEIKFWTKSIFLCPHSPPPPISLSPFNYPLIFYFSTWYDFTPLAIFLSFLQPSYLLNQQVLLLTHSFSCCNSSFTLTASCSVNNIGAEVGRKSQTVQAAGCRAWVRFIYLASGNAPLHHSCAEIAFASILPLFFWRLLKS